MVSAVLSSWAIHTVQFWCFDDRVASYVPPGPAIVSPFSAADWEAVHPLATLPSPSRWRQFIIAGRRESLGWRRVHEVAAVWWWEGSDLAVQPERLVVTESGWPARSLTQLYYHRSQGLPVQVVVVERTPGLSWRGGIQAWPDVTTFSMWPTRFALPLLPLWPGFAINTALYGMLILLALRTPGALRRTLRRRRGDCLACGYYLSGLSADAACPECGKDVSG